MKDKIYTHDEAALLIELFEDILIEAGIKVPSPEDCERDPDDDAGLYGSTYYSLLGAVEERLLDLLARHTQSTEVVEYVFSGVM